MAVLAATLVRTILIQIYYIPSSSMEPTLQIDDRVLVLKNTFIETDISSGDVVVFYSPQTVFKDDYIEEFVESIQIWKLTNNETYLNLSLIHI